MIFLFSLNNGFIIYQNFTNFLTMHCVIDKLESSTTTWSKFHLTWIILSNLTILISILCYDDPHLESNRITWILKS